MAIQSCGNVDLWLCSCVAMWLYGRPPIRPYLVPPCARAPPPPHKVGVHKVGGARLNSMNLMREDDKKYWIPMFSYVFYKNSPSDAKVPTAIPHKVPAPRTRPRPAQGRHKVLADRVRGNNGLANSHMAMWL